MGTVAASLDIAGASVTDAERLWYDPLRWATFVDGFGHEVAHEGQWPRAGSTLTWDSRAGGRGRVLLRVIEHEPGAGQLVAVEDPQLSGSERVRFVALADGVAVGLELEYALKQRGPLRALTDLLFIRRALRDSLRRTLERFACELEAETAP